MSRFKVGDRVRVNSPGSSTHRHGGKVERVILRECGNLCVVGLDSGHWPYYDEGRLVAEGDLTITDLSTDELREWIADWCLCNDHRSFLPAGYEHEPSEAAFWGDWRGLGQELLAEYAKRCGS